MRFARRAACPLDVPWRKLSKPSAMGLDGEGEWEDDKWYGVRRFFDWLETKSYKMHIRVLLSKYRALCNVPDCEGARLKPEALLLASRQTTPTDVLAPEQCFTAARSSAEACHHVPGLTVHDVMLLPIDRCHAFFERSQLPAPLDEATKLLAR